ncbi:7189_t:CDS:2, partial [Dentiscutata heterogama]
LGSKENLDFASKLSSKIDNILEVSLDPCNNETSYKVKYEEFHIFSMSEVIVTDLIGATYNKDDRYNEEGNRYDKCNGYNKGDRYNEGDRYKNNHKQTSTIKKQYKIEIYLEKHKAVLKNKEGSTTLEPISYTYIKELANKIQWPKFILINLEDAMVGSVSSLGFLIEYEVFENKVLKGNRLKVAELYYKFLLLETGLLVVAPFFDSNLESDEVTIQMPGFSSNILARKLQTYTTSGPCLVKLLETLNNNWVLYDLIDDITII